MTAAAPKAIATASYGVSLTLCWVLSRTSERRATDQALSLARGQGTSPRMKAGKAYISSLGTTGLLLTSSLMLLVVVGALIAFDAWPTDGSANNPETISIAQTERADVKSAQGKSHEAAGSHARRSDRISARSVRAAARRIASGGSASAGEDQVISDLQAPGSDGSGPTGGAAAGGGAPPAADPALGTPL